MEDTGAGVTVVLKLHQRHPGFGGVRCSQRRGINADQDDHYRLTLCQDLFKDMSPHGSAYTTRGRHGNHVHFIASGPATQYGLGFLSCNSGHERTIATAAGQLFTVGVMQQIYRCITTTHHVRVVLLICCWDAAVVLGATIDIVHFSYSVVSTVLSLNRALHTGDHRTHIDTAAAACIQGDLAYGSRRYTYASADRSKGFRYFHMDLLAVDLVHGVSF